MNLVDKYNKINYDSVIKDNSLRNIIDSRPNEYEVSSVNLTASVIPGAAIDGSVISSDTVIASGSLSPGLISARLSDATISRFDVIENNISNLTAMIQPINHTPNTIRIDRSCRMRFDDGTIITATGVTIDFES